MSVRYTVNAPPFTDQGIDIFLERFGHLLRHGKVFGCRFEGLVNPGDGTLRIQMSAALPEEQRAHLGLPDPVVVP